MKKHRTQVHLIAGLLLFGAAIYLSLENFEEEKPRIEVPKLIKTSEPSKKGKEDSEEVSANVRLKFQAGFAE